MATRIARLCFGSRGWKHSGLAGILALGLVLLGRAHPVLAETHVVAPGETLSDIADLYGVSVDELAAENGITDPDHIVAGQEIHIGRASASTAAPAATTYVVLEGETLSDIATRFGTSIAAIAALNGLDDPDSIFPGERLLIPSAPAGPRVSKAEARNILRAAEREFGLPSGLLLALAWQESGWQQGITSEAGAVGITQLLPETADWAIEQLVPDAHNWRGSATDNARMGAAVLAFYLHRSGGDERMALAAYYQGWRSVFEKGLFDETVDYVNNVLALQAEFES